MRNTKRAFGAVSGWASLGVALWSTTALATDYGRQLATTYFPQQTTQEPGAYYCGAATTEMILATSGVGKNPAPIVGPPALSTQDQLYTAAQAGNGNNGRYYVNPAGLRAALTQYDPPAGGRSYIAYSNASYDAANRIMAYDIDHYAVTAGALLYQGGHWVNVYGVSTNVQPSTTNVGNGTLIVKGFNIQDPWTGAHGGGLGENAFLANAYKTVLGVQVPIGKWNLDFTPTNYGGTWQGKYCFVADPDPGDDSILNSAPDAVDAMAPIDAATAQADAGLDTSAISDLSDDASFENGGFSSTGEMEINDPASGDMDWIVPFDQTTDPNPALDASAVALIDADTGTLVGAYWDEGDFEDSLTAFDQSITEQNSPTATFETDDVPVPEPTIPALAVIAGIILLTNRRRKETVSAG